MDESCASFRSSTFTAPTARVIAFYLPQFHPIPENDRFWGAGFTEWTNVAKAKPLFRGHVQPRLPRELGFYDLRLPIIREQQAELALSNGIEGFCYWHYWLGGGRRVLERPFQEVLESGTPKMPFSLAWANHSWTGVWSGSPNKILLEQTYPGQQDEVDHFNWAIRAFEDQRYQRVEGKPIFFVFAPHELPNATAFIEHWRELAIKSGLPGIFFVGFADRRDEAGRYTTKALQSFDAVVPHPPHDYIRDRNRSVTGKLSKLILSRDFRKIIPHEFFGRSRRPMRYRYSQAVRTAFHDLPQGDRFLPCIMPGWDNTPRSGVDGVVFENATPDLFAEYLEKAIRIVNANPPDRRIVFVKAWNEWAEGNILEPDNSNGIAYLEVIRRVVRSGCP
uniref:glycosyltransferase WbsX family protein n=1 Tax=Methylobacterium sp. B34 TaxID=95563 RepID=UPI00034BEF02|nr:glycoside hydrolase family 99-like domain-containing protein [Methylobacterium sp. B34]